MAPMHGLPYEGLMMLLQGPRMSRSWPIKDHVLLTQILKQIVIQNQQIDSLLITHSVRSTCIIHDMAFPRINHVLIHSVWCTQCLCCL